jgi:ABC-type sugar transport system ATPase subunit
MAQVRITDLNKIYENGMVALDQVSLQISSGEFLVLVGPSGCGKSTLLRSIAGLETPTSGTIEIGGIRVNELRPADRYLGMVFQDYALYPHMKVRENLAFGLKLKKMVKHEIQSRIDEIAHMLALGDLLDRKPAQLSGGQRQRVAIGRALVKRPQVLLLDEPLSNLDAQLRARTRVEIAALHRKIGSTSIYVTHDQEEAMVLADRIAVMRNGKIQQVDAPMTIYRQPANRFVASFIGSPSMNFLEGSLNTSEGRSFFETEGQRIFLEKKYHPAEPGRYTIGLRPESFAGIQGIQEIQNSGLVAHLTWIEMHGHEIHAIARLGSQRITLRTSDPQLISLFLKLTPEEPFCLTLNPEFLHWFKDTPEGARVPTGRP